MEGWLSRSFAAPSSAELVDMNTPRPPTKAQPSTEVGPHMVGLRSDEEFSTFLNTSKPGTAVIEFGTSWCTKCHEIFPAFYALTKKYSQHKYAVAQVELMAEVATQVRYTPTFGIYRNGRKVDQVVGKEPQMLEDHLWLHSD